MFFENCKVCGKKFRIFPHEIKTGKRLYCSRLCFSNSTRGRIMPHAENHWNWKGNATYKSIHSYLRSHNKKPKLCEVCKKRPPYDLAFKNDKAGYNNLVYTRNISDYQWLCRKCHLKRDGRFFKLKNHSQEQENLVLTGVG